MINIRRLPAVFFPKTSALGTGLPLGLTEPKANNPVGGWQMKRLNVRRHVGKGWSTQH